MRTRLIAWRRSVVDRKKLAQFETYRFCAGFRMPAIDSRATFTGGRRPKAAKERTRGDSAERLPRTPLWGFELRDKCEGWCAEPLAAVDEPGRQQQLGLLVEIIVESCSCGLGSMMGRRICASVVAAGAYPALAEVTASSQDSDRGHDVSILMAVIGPVGR
jgi:hypothetical protein